MSETFDGITLYNVPQDVQGLPSCQLVGFCYKTFEENVKAFRKSKPDETPDSCYKWGTVYYFPVKERRFANESYDTRGS